MRCECSNKFSYTVPTCRRSAGLLGQHRQGVGSASSARRIPIRRSLRASGRQRQPAQVRPIASWLRATIDHLESVGQRRRISASHSHAPPLWFQRVFQEGKDSHASAVDPSRLTCFPPQVDPLRTRHTTAEPTLPRQSYSIQRLHPAPVPVEPLQRPCSSHHSTSRAPTRTCPRPKISIAVLAYRCLIDSVLGWTGHRRSSESTCSDRMPSDRYLGSGSSTGGVGNHKEL